MWSELLQPLRREREREKEFRYAFPRSGELSRAPRLRGERSRARARGSSERAPERAVSRLQYVRAARSPCVHVCVCSESAVSPPRATHTTLACSIVPAQPVFFQIAIFSVTLFFRRIVCALSSGTEAEEDRRRSCISDTGDQSSQWEYIAGRARREGNSRGPGSRSMILPVYSPRLSRDTPPVKVKFVHGTHSESGPAPCLSLSLSLSLSFVLSSLPCTLSPPSSPFSSRESRRNCRNQAKGERGLTRDRRKLGNRQALCADDVYVCACVLKFSSENKKRSCDEFLQKVCEKCERRALAL